MTNIRELLAKCELPLSVEETLKLKGLPFGQWPERAKTEWYWKGKTRKGRVANGQWHRARALIQVNNRTISPARPLWEYFTGEALDPKARIAYYLRGIRGADRDDVNPAHYILLHPRAAPKRKNKRHAHVLPDAVALMEMSGYYPTTVEEFLARWPDLKSYSREDIDATIREVAL